ncbi:ribitol-5-phosphate transferase FKTN-like [Macrosteles quadrilineatus]|uniref:ribitol-5-phosphate transferase FKTN-like n=1 Tax=Macrosteles quadrilineatus TaxID=74068 RepID=UPI0023E0C2D8|nr:ribitol-5-phosphate transferase FKTN-like [Macrosteles quadrilineatus]
MSKIKYYFCKKKSFTVICFYIGFLCLTLQFVVFFVLLHTLDDKGILTSDEGSNKFCRLYMSEDIEILALLTTKLGFSFVLLDERFLDPQAVQNNKILNLQCSHCDYCKPLILALDYGTYFERRKQFLTKIVDEDFNLITFYNIHPDQSVPELDHVEIAVFLTRKSTVQVVLLHPREDNTWWFGDLHSDLSGESKLASLNLTYRNINLMAVEGSTERFETVPSQLKDDSSLLLPKDIKSFLSDLSCSKFIECNTTRATLFRSKFKPDQSPEARRFRHKVWKMLSRVKTVMDSLKIPFWLSSGTALGYFRECDIIAHSKDVDIGTWATSYSPQIVMEMQRRGFRLKISLGFPNDSLELSFVDESGIKLDIFFFYQDEEHYWNGGTQVKSGKKFKYDFPKFSLCWTLFKDLRVRIPCETEEYIKANYGPDWFVPVTSWDWKTSPFNVKPNGMWRTDQLTEAIKLYPT